eukprot:TRINITY_DN52055_c0_g1_i1.p1 TRINITY_DN52055_c0_g1~~TRINITY_DN52055_c0_g1_i1.p1  ORF type:complete len:152 (-),score=44.19 TRINITY_DN52055_c0_g1_i1:230-685(-)
MAAAQQQQQNIPPALAKKLEPLQKTLNGEVQKIRDIQAKMQKHANAKIQMAAQQHENETVKEELGLLKPGEKVYKLIGPALVQQEVEDATTIVEKRLEYMAKEQSRIDKLIDECQSEQEDHRKKVMEIQQQAQELAQKFGQQQQQERSIPE